jgi:hypothetical protein
LSLTYGGNYFLFVVIKVANDIVLLCKCNVHEIKKPQQGKNVAG